MELKTTRIISDGSNSNADSRDSETLYSVYSYKVNEIVPKSTLLARIWDSGCIIYPKRKIVDAGMFKETPDGPYYLTLHFQDTSCTIYGTENVQLFLRDMGARNQCELVGKKVGAYSPGRNTYDVLFISENHGGIKT